MSNLIKSNNISFTQLSKVVIDANTSEYLKNINVISDYNDREVMENVVDEDVVNRNNECANIIIEQANEKAEKIIEDARKQSIEIFDEAQKTGYEKGMESAHDEIEQIKIKELEEIKNRYHYKEEALVDKYEKELENIEPIVVDAVCKLIHKVVGIEISDKKDVIMYLINNAIKDVENNRKFLIKVSLDDFEFVSQHQDEIYGATNPSIEIEIFAEAKLNKNQCIIETDSGLINLSLDEQLNNLISSLMLISNE